MADAPINSEDLLGSTRRPVTQVVGSKHPDLDYLTTNYCSHVKIKLGRVFYKCGDYGSNMDQIISIGWKIKYQATKHFLGANLSTTRPKQGAQMMCKAKVQGTTVFRILCCEVDCFKQSTSAIFEFLLTLSFRSTCQSERITTTVSQYSRAMKLSPLGAIFDNVFLS